MLVGFASVKLLIRIGTGLDHLVTQCENQTWPDRMMEFRWSHQSQLKVFPHPGFVAEPSTIRLPVRMSECRGKCEYYFSLVNWLTGGLPVNQLTVGKLRLSRLKIRNMLKIML
jgi:hypothetical protein